MLFAICIGLNLVAGITLARVGWRWANLINANAFRAASMLFAIVDIPALHISCGRTQLAARETLNVELNRGVEFATCGEAWQALVHCFLFVVYVAALGLGHFAGHDYESVGSVRPLVFERDACTPTFFEILNLHGVWAFHDIFHCAFLFHHPVQPIVVHDFEAIHVEYAAIIRLELKFVLACLADAQTTRKANSEIVRSGESWPLSNG
jgi:hypothetical protein